MIVPKTQGLRRSRRTDDDVEVAEQSRPLLFEALSREISPQPVAMAHHSAARKFGGQALIAGRNLRDHGPHFLMPVVRQTRRHNGVQELDVKPSGGRKIRQEARLAFDISAGGDELF